MQSQCNLNQNHNGIFHSNEINEPKSCMESQNIPIIILEAGGIILPDLKLYYKVIVI